MGALENVFSWSKSRDETLRDCQRKYFYDKYASWGGWDRSAPELARQAYILKNLKNRWAWKGERVHHVIEDVMKSLRSGKPVPYEKAAQMLTDGMRADYKSSKGKKYMENPKHNLGLFEHEYQKPVTDDTWRKIHSEAADCLKHFYESDLYKELLAEDKSNWLIIEDLEEFDFDGAKIYVKLDFARRKNGLIEIFDWKTGKNDAEAASVQIGAYAMYAMKKWNIALSDIRAYLFNLGSPKPVPQSQLVNAILIQNTIQVMSLSIQSMRELLSDPDKNVPLEMDAFKFTENAALCNNCCFYRICSKYAVAK